ncbi:hypothetical protein FKW77_004462 [Venturia effusa]|uniref:alpha-1,2-Mannosidase n=1 Tax=Venturia effusa TaxID=50376 RepID=A0A517LR87_9PEZI|nr:hypothetical protein FKW77_004462 [Venturia effusa]
MHVLSILGLLIIPSIASPVPDESNQPLKRAPSFRVQADRAGAVKEAFSFAWDGYHKYAFPADELNPLTKGKGYSRNGWGATAVDALSTAILMEIPSIVQTIVDYVPTIDYTRTSNLASDDVSVFETTIRYLGGMLAGYDLLEGPFSDLLIPSSKNVKALLQQSITLANTMSFAFNTPSGVPDNSIKVNTMQRSNESTGLAVAGTLVLEWTRLSDITGDPIYAKLVQRGEEHLLRPKFEPPLVEPFPGLLGSEIDINTGRFLDNSGGWVGGTDSYYEYLIKMFAYDSKRFGEYRDRWIAAADSSIKHLGSNPSTRPDLTFMAAYDGKNPVYVSQHLACFDGGNFIYGGMVLGEQKYIDFGLKLTAGCRATYTATATQIGPEVFRWLPPACAKIPSPMGNTSNPATPTMLQERELIIKREAPLLKPAGDDGWSSPQELPDGQWSKPSPISGELQCAEDEKCQNKADQISNDAPAPPPTGTVAQAPAATPTTLPLCSSVPANQSAFYEKNGFWVTNGYYDLRPEVIESYYYAYRITGDTKYQEWAWEAFLAINKTARTPNGFSSFTSVDTPGGGKYGNNQESFFFAEVMKYAYLIFARDGPWQINYRGDGKDKFVFNTEAHPVKVVNPPA